MFCYEKILQYPINIKKPNPLYAKIIISQYGGPKRKKIEKTPQRKNYIQNDHTLLYEKTPSFFVS